ncbi:MAG TPA: 3-oxoacyl-ACP reductase FabG [Gammaproteobacteria bacterium]|jgi:3-oxoacyl-[acyl-carrier protein] reductase|nr:3-oxoacyl-ACP reductase FabG [Gammaproteobacteria bacterium]
MSSSSIPKLPGIAGRTALVTGASRGIGRAIAEALASQGAVVIGTATTEQGAAQISGWIGAVSTGSRGALLDVGSDASVEALFAGFTNAPEIVVNNAGITRDNLLMRMKPEEWNDVVSTNLSSLYRVCKASLRGMMKARYGRIINISSVVGLMGNAGQTNYAAAKAGMIGFTKSLAREIASRNVTVNVIAPGFIDTDMTRALDEKQVQALRQQIPLARLGTSADIAAAVAFLASDLGGYITGETLNVNGGLSMQ